MAIKQSKGERAFTIFNYLFLGGFALICLFPFVHVIAQSLSSQRAIVSGEVLFLPIETTFLAYKEVLMDQHFLKAFSISVLRTVVGTFVNVFFTCLMAYPLSKTYIKGRGLILFMVVFTMLFSGGMIPTYLVVRETGLLNSFWAYIIPTMISAFNLIIVKNFFQSIPAELEESAKMDGASNIGILFKIVIPLSMPVIATIGLFHAVFHWNSFFDAVLYINDRSLYPLQVYLRELIQFDQSEINLRDNFEQQLLANESLKAAALISSTLPILIVYPFLQKYFVKGVMLGSVKG
ncbi:carbohydrate ABC transporter permease [Sutcliffiella cohnii]|uniref:carbohydrate ABC transporter permease n=1 Tax=Sutcliffiella sp. NC1 TaxID=3004096 RepID=UPI0022DE132A|nr:carbohydrate ABC transporter permease [Sutcliffiella sp. NC1]WBL16646.1 carbohydrate ABC transporter permease [Sutcliffiella sp. NC1]